MIQNPLRLFVVGGLCIATCLASTEAQNIEPSLSLTVMFLEQPPPGRPAALWTVIRNVTTSVQAFCRHSWGYTFLPVDPNGTPFVEAEASLHACGGDVSQGFVLLLPGESRFESISVPYPLDGTSSLRVDLRVSSKAIASVAAATESTLRWNGRVSDAFALGEKLKGAVR